MNELDVWRERGTNEGGRMRNRGRKEWKEERKGKMRAR